LIEILTHLANIVRQRDKIPAPFTFSLFFTLERKGRKT